MPSSHFDVNGRTVLITGGSRGMGLCAAQQLAAKGANVVIVGRDVARLNTGLDYVKSGAKRPETQRFHQISADLTSSSEASRVIDEVVEWNKGQAPDVVWCCAGSSHPTLFVDTPISAFESQMDSNYFTSVYIAHAVMQYWLRDVKKTENNSLPPFSPEVGTRHLIFTASFVSFYPFVGYAPYAPSKAALRSLSDSLSQEMNLYPVDIRVRTCFPATITGEGFDAENLMKPDVTKLLEEGDSPQSPEVVAAKSIKALEANSGGDLVCSDFQTGLVSRSALGGSVRGGFLRGLVDVLMGSIMVLVMVFVRWDMDKKVRDFGRKHGVTGMKTAKE